MEPIKGKINIKVINGLEYLYVNTNGQDHYCGKVGERNSLQNAYNLLGQPLLGSVFISHSNQDQNQSKEFRNLLIANGIFPYLAEDSQTLGQEITRKITNAINNSDVFVLILTKNSLLSPWIPIEVWTWDQENQKRNNTYPIVILKEEGLRNSDIPSNILSVIAPKDHITVKNPQDTIKAVQAIMDYLGQRQKTQTAAAFILGAVLLLALFNK